MDKQRKKIIQKRYLEKTKDIPRLQEEVKELQVKLGILTQDTFKPLEGPGKPVRKQVDAHLGREERTRLVRLSRLRYERAYYKWLSDEAKRLEIAYQTLEENVQPPLDFTLFD